MIELIILKVDLDQEVFLHKSVGFSIGNFYNTKQEHAFNFYVYHNCIIMMWLHQFVNIFWGCYWDQSWWCRWWWLHDVIKNFKLRLLTVELDILVKNCQDAQILASSFKVIPLKKKVIKQIFLNLIHLSVPYLMSVSKNTINKIGCCACLGDIMGQTYSTYAYTGTYYMRHFIVKVHFAAVNGSKSF